jgi:hypothetical protein
MKSPQRSLALLLAIILGISTVSLFQNAIAQSSTDSSVTKFSLSYRAENNTIIATITKPTGVDAYNFRWKEHESQTWHYNPFHSEDSSPPYFEADAYGIPSQAYSLSPTELALSFIPKTQMGKQIDIQVQALYGSYKAVPYGHAMILPGGPTYDFSFDGQVGAWSSTQTITYGEATPSPTVPEFPATAILPLFIVIPFIAAICIRKYAAKMLRHFIKNGKAFCLVSLGFCVFGKALNFPLFTLHLRLALIALL